MSDITLTLATSLDAAALAATHTVAFVSEVGDGTLRVRYSGPRGSGVSTMVASAPLARVLGILREASGMTYGDLDGSEQVATFVPSPDRFALTPNDCHAQRAYSVWMHSV
jgi:hypothetical protein